MKNLVMSAVLVGLVVSTSGCCSYLRYSASKDEILRSRVYASGNVNAVRAVKAGVDAESAIKAVPMGEGVGIGVDVLALDALSQHPWQQLGAAILDAASLYGAGLGVQKLTEGSSGNDGRNNVGVNVVNQSGDVQVNVNGSGDNGTGTSGNGRDNYHAAP